MPTAAEAMYPDGPSRVLGNQAQAIEEYPPIDHEDTVPDNMGRNFEHLYSKLRSLKDKVKPGNVLRLMDKEGYDYYYQRDDNYEHGFSLFRKPPAEVM